VKIVVLLKAIYRVNKMTIKIPMSFLVQTLVLPKKKKKKEKEKIVEI
jgi:hypothetical protein